MGWYAMLLSISSPYLVPILAKVGIEPEETFFDDKDRNGLEDEWSNTIFFNSQPQIS